MHGGIFPEPGDPQDVARHAEQQGILTHLERLQVDVHIHVPFQAENGHISVEPAGIPQGGERLRMRDLCNEKVVPQLGIVDAGEQFHEFLYVKSLHGYPPLLCLFVSLSVDTYHI